MAEVLHGNAYRRIHLFHQGDPFLITSFLMFQDETKLAQRTKQVFWWRGDSCCGDSTEKIGSLNCSHFRGSPLQQRIESVLHGLCNFLLVGIEPRESVRPLKEIVKASGRMKWVNFWTNAVLGSLWRPSQNNHVISTTGFEPHCGPYWIALLDHTLDLSLLSQEVYFCWIRAEPVVNSVKVL